ncbi:MAG: acyl carrier protein [Gemmatimonadetes bacterium]|nr:MAG: acyl carrier protein [Gemmatimonadota bacterium]
MKLQPLDRPDPIAVGADLEARIGALFTDKLHIEVPSPDTDLVETGLLDSLRFVELLAHLEETFDLTVSVDDIEVEHFRTTARIAEFIARRLPRLRAEGAA